MSNVYNNVYGVTGIMGSGKTVVSKILETLGAKVIYADEIAKHILTMYYPQYSSILKEITNKILPHNNKENLPVIEGSSEYTLHVNRNHLASIVFQNNDILTKFNQIIHPHIKKLFIEIKEKYELDPNTIIIYDAPLIYELNLENQFKKIILSYTPKELVIQRLLKKKHFTITDIKQRLKYQISIDKKKEKADYIINNTKDITFLEKQVKSLWRELSHE